MGKYYDQEDEWRDDENCHLANDLLDRWFSSDTWKTITVTADLGDKSSIRLMSEVSDQMCNLVFHLKNKSPDVRVQYELKYFTDLCDHFGVA
mgnify:CR=1 FL=1|tara:strand:- start:267 stop:542 length:276 start_codon:yes stop_codon:yes gene_type:complete